ncbi:MAG TPA: sensor histidine kinase [Vicinamibacterales bacterium]|jgi:signal transduction histidine kinase|nr:sensor histidine kinase [Vicinamibacterales bacterium]
MRLKTWLVAALGLGSLVVLLAFSMVASSRKVQEIYPQLDQLNEHYRQVDVNLRRLRSDVNLSGIFVRDYLLDVAREHAPEYREQIADFRRTNMTTLAELKTLIDRDDQIQSLQSKLDDYWQAFDPLFDWTPAEKVIRSAGFLRREVVPRREAALAIAQQIEELNNTNLATQRAKVAERYAALRGDLQWLLRQTVLLGLGVAIVVVLRLRVLERRSDQAENQMRELSQRLVDAQEEERRNLSRELHDHVAQVLTGLRMELGRVERMSAAVSPAIVECKKLVDDMFRTVRDLSLGLRPSMLDDFGLEAALEWHVRDFMRRYAIDVDLQMDGDFDTLPDKHRTCVYRVIQEAMTNCARHANATHIQIAVAADNGQLRVSVSDDGVGFAPAHRHRGLGLRGIDERVRELEGTLTISRSGRAGTMLLVRLPLPVPMMEAPLARVAG